MPNKKEIKKFEDSKVEFRVKDVDLVIQLIGQTDQIVVKYDDDYGKEDPDAYTVNGEIDVGIIFDEEFIEEVLSLTDNQYEDLIFNLNVLRTHTKELVSRIEKLK